MTDQPKKKLPFKATALRKSSESTTGSKPPEDDDSLGLFDRRKEMLPIIAAEQQRRAKKKEKERADARQKTTSNKESTVDLVGDGKRPREESECESQMEPGDSFPEIPTPPSKRSRVGNAPIEDTAASPLVGTPESPVRSKPKGKTAVAQESATLHVGPVVELDDDPEISEETNPNVNVTREESLEIFEVAPEPIEVPEEDDNPFNDAGEENGDPDSDWLQKYVDRARKEKAKLEASRALSAGPDNQATASSSTAASPDAEIWLYLTSPIPGTWQGIVIKRRITQTLGLVLDAWKERQRARQIELPQGEGSNVFLTWKTERLYSTTTPLSLGINPTGPEGLESTSNGSREGFTAGWRQLHLEVWTEDLYKKHLEKKAREKRTVEVGDDESESEVEQLESEAKIRVILKAKDDEPAKVTVKPTTTVGTLITFYRQVRGIPQARSVTLRFDGDRLQENMTVEEADISDMDSIDVIVK